VDELACRILLLTRGAYEAALQDLRKNILPEPLRGLTLDYPFAIRVQVDMELLIAKDVSTIVPSGIDGLMVDLKWEVTASGRFHSLNSADPSAHKRLLKDTSIITPISKIDPTDTIL
jgi:hypothetical protein